MAKFFSPLTFVLFFFFFLCVCVLFVLSISRLYTAAWVTFNEAGLQPGLLLAAARFLECFMSTFLRPPFNVFLVSLSQFTSFEPSPFFALRA